MLEWIKMRLYEKSRSLALALGLLSIEMSQETSCIGTDGYTLYVNEDWMKQMFLEDSERLCETVLHVLCHCMLQHPFRYERESRYPDLQAIGTAFPEKEAWDLVDEILGNPHKENKSGVQARWYQDDHRFWEGHSWENGRKAMASDAGAGPGSGSKGQGESGQERLSHARKQEQMLRSQNQEHPQRDQSQAGQQELWQRAYRAVTENRNSGSRHAGSRKMSVVRSLTLTNEKRYDYRSFLKGFSSLREEGSLDMEQFDYGFYFWGLSQYGNVPLIEPLEYREQRKIEELVIVIDTSGSCSKELVRMFLEETRNILKEEDLFFRRFLLHIIQCDNQIQRDDCITCQEELDWYLEDLQVKGGGGTDFRPAFERIEELRKTHLHRLKGVLYFTDGCGIYPREMPDYQVTFVFLKYRYDDIDVPDWAGKLVLDAKRPKGAEYEY